ncbi:MAG TPA: CoA pyrophosphatase [Solirubrobacteraceae bacterium]|nr:CoA pyrophosphatase [Solirubrobacteraceae bacterium]
MPAAVLVPVRALAGGEIDVVFTLRRDDLRHHAGEISFPGGRHDVADASLRETALREAEEEIGLARAHVRLLGELSPVSTFATGYEIHPFVGQIPQGMAWRASSSEVDAVLELPLSALRSGQSKVRLERRGITFQTDAYTVGDHMIWGATARILAELLERISHDCDGDMLSLP